MSTFVCKSPYTTSQFNPILEYNSWAKIREAADGGIAGSLWSVGDRKSVLLQGTAGSLVLNDTYYAFILGFDHNVRIEGYNTIHFQFGKTVDWVDIAFCDWAYGKPETSGSWFNMNNSLTNSGGWRSSRMRETILPSFENCMPASLRSSLRSITKYSDNTGGGSDTASYVTATIDTVFLLAEFEVFGARIYANSAEKNYQAQYAWYSAGNSKVRYRHSATDSTANWWLRSVHAGTSDRFCCVSTSGGSYGYMGATASRGFAPAFCI